MKTTRREFVKQLTLASAIIGCGEAFVFLNGCTSIKFIEGNVIDNKIIEIPLSAFVTNDFAIVKNKETEAGPIFIKKDPNGQYTAVLMVCTHKGCELRPSRNILLCPCHGSEFAANGDVINPPATDKLKQYKTSINYESVYINLH